MFFLQNVCRRRVSKGGNISPILEGDESIEIGNVFIIL